jgi:hypothetical protein
MVKSSVSRGQDMDETPKRQVPRPKPIGMNLRLTPKQHEALQRIATERKVPIMSLLREGVAEVLRRHGR